MNPADWTGDWKRFFVGDIKGKDATQ